MANAGNARQHKAGSHADYRRLQCRFFVATLVGPFTLAEKTRWSTGN